MITAGYCRGLWAFWSGDWSFADANKMRITVLERDISAVNLMRNMATKFITATPRR